jgi:argininosuccinate lyase
MLTTNLPTGYHRELQLLKEVLFPALTDIRDIISMANMMLHNISVVENITTDPKYKYMFSVEVVNNMVLEGTPFREAYKTVGLDIEHGRFEAPTSVHHTHEGSIGNLCNDKIGELMNNVMEEFGFDRVEKAEYELAH